jgi:hypothetical protein
MAPAARSVGRPSAKGAEAIQQLVPPQAGPASEEVADEGNSRAADARRRLAICSQSEITPEY